MSNAYNNFISGFKKFISKRNVGNLCRKCINKSNICCNCTWKFGPPVDEINKYIISHFALDNNILRSRPLKYTNIFGMKNKVLCSHACSLSIRDENEVLKILEGAAHAGIGLTCLPSTNLWLQDNNEKRTPRFRGLAPIIEAKNYGIPVMIASDNCQDSFYPFGNHNLLEIFKLALISGHLDENSWFESITNLPSNWMGFNNHISEGSDATFLKFNENSISEIVSISNQNFEIWEKGEFFKN